MPFEQGLSRSWFNKGVKAGRAGRHSDMYAAWSKATGKPKTPGGRVTAQESFYQGYFDGQDSRKKNPGKSVRLKNFTGTVRVNPQTKQAEIKGRQKKNSARAVRKRVGAALKKYVRKNPAGRRYRLDYKDNGRARVWAVFDDTGYQVTTYGTKTAAMKAIKQYRAEAKKR